MRARRIVCAAVVFLGCAVGQAAASPPIALPSAPFLHADRGIDTVRWRHRHDRSFYWSGRDDRAGSADTDGYASGASRDRNGAVPRAGSGIFRLDPPRRRGWVNPPPPR